MACSTRGWQRRLTLSEAVRRFHRRGGIAAERVDAIIAQHHRRLPASIGEGERFKTVEGTLSSDDRLVLESECWPTERMTHHLEWNWERQRAPR